MEMRGEQSVGTAKFSVSWTSHLPVCFFFAHLTEFSHIYLHYRPLFGFLLALIFGCFSNYCAIVYCIVFFGCRFNLG